MNPPLTRAALEAALRIEPAAVARQLVEFLRAAVAEARRDGVVFGLSGGVDSATVAVLCREAVGAGKTLALLMPDRDSDPRHLEDALGLVDALGIRSKLLDLTAPLEALGVYRIRTLGALPLPPPLKARLVRWAVRRHVERTGRQIHEAAVGILPDGMDPKPFGRGVGYGRVKHRLRRTLAYLWSDLENRLVVGAANRTEHEIGFYVRHGIDDEADALPLQALYKTQVRALAEHLGVPARIRDKAPSPDGGHGMDDEHLIGMPYEQLDLILAALAQGWGTGEIAGALAVGEEPVRYVQRLVEGAERMRRVRLPGPVAGAGGR